MSLSGTNHLENILANMEAISLKEMDHVKLMHRRDTKFVVPTEKLESIIELVREKYKVLEIDKQRIHAYHTLYYDTPVLEMYQNHHNGHLNRYKVRVRKYLTSDISFLEVKFKNNKRETIKKRIRPEKPENINSEKSDQFLNENSPYSSNDIQPSLSNSFQRITFVHRTIPERITIDISLSFSDIDGTGTYSLPHLSVIEVKRDRDSERSDMIKVLRKKHIHSMGFSKYCMGTALVKKDVKSNLFRQRIRLIGRFEKTFFSA
jgi:hypothetical protein